MKLTCIEYSVEDNIALVTLNRPSKLNAINLQMFQELDSISKHIRTQRDIRGVILKANGKDFCSGLDIKSVMKSPSSVVTLLKKLVPGNANLAQRVSLAWRRLPVPVIAAIQGRCYGGGTQIILGADMRFCTPEAEFSIMETKWGMLPDMAGLVGLREIIPRDQALKLTLSSEVISATQAREINLVTDTCADPVAKAKEILQTIMTRSPDAVSAAKHSINRSWSGSIRGVLRRETLYQIRLLLGKNLRIAGKRQLEAKDTPYNDRARW